MNTLTTTVTDCIDSIWSGLGFFPQAQLELIEPTDSIVLTTGQTDHVHVLFLPFLIREEFKYSILGIKTMDVYLCGFWNQNSSSKDLYKKNVSKAINQI